MTYLEVGNVNAIEGYRDEATHLVRYRPVDGERSTTWVFPPDASAVECFRMVVGSIDRHFAEGATPAWIDTDSDALRELLVDHFGLDKKKATKKPAGWGDPEHPVVNEEGKTAPKKRASRAKKATEAVKAVPEFVAVQMALFMVLATRFQLRTLAGRDYQARLMGDAASDGTGPYSSASIMAVSQDSAVPTLDDLSLPGEITIGTLARKSAAYSHTVGTSSYALTALWSFDQDATIYKIGVYAGDSTLVFESMLDAPVIGKPGDTATVTETITL